MVDDALSIPVFPVWWSWFLDSARTWKQIDQMIYLANLVRTIRECSDSPCSVDLLEASQRMREEPPTPHFVLPLKPPVSAYLSPLTLVLVALPFWVIWLPRCCLCLYGRPQFNPDQPVSIAKTKHLRSIYYDCCSTARRHLQHFMNTPCSWLCTPPSHAPAHKLRPRAAF
jgi:hypothetical protein